MMDVYISLLYVISMHKILIVNVIKVILHRKYVPKNPHTVLIKI